MDLSHPLRSLVPSLDAIALEVLAGTHSALGASRIHQLGGSGSRQGIVNVLGRLAEHGLVLAEPTNHGFSYRLNRDHLLASAVLEAADVRGTFFRRMGAACSALSPSPVSAAVFGSVARGDSGPSSDIDLLLVVEDATLSEHDRWLDEVDGLTLAVESWTGNRLEVITRTISDLHRLVREGEPIIDSWRDEAVTVVGADLRQLLGVRLGNLARIAAQ